MRAAAHQAVYLLEAFRRVEDVQRALEALHLSGELNPREKREYLRLHGQLEGALNLIVTVTEGLTE